MLNGVQASARPRPSHNTHSARRDLERSGSSRRSCPRLVSRVNGQFCFNLWGPGSTDFFPERGDQVRPSLDTRNLGLSTASHNLASSLRTCAQPVTFSPCPPTTARPSWTHRQRQRGSGTQPGPPESPGVPVLHTVSSRHCSRPPGTALAPHTVFRRCAQRTSSRLEATVRGLLQQDGLRPQPHPQPPSRTYRTVLKYPPALAAAPDSSRQGPRCRLAGGPGQRGGRVTLFLGRRLLQDHLPTSRRRHTRHHPRWSLSHLRVPYRQPEHLH